MSERTWKETITGSGEQLVEAVKKLFHEGNVRRVIIKQGPRTVAEFPLSIGVIGAVLAPVVTAIAAIAAVLTDCSLEVERAVEVDDQKSQDVA